MFKEYPNAFKNKQNKTRSVEKQHKTKHSEENQRLTNINFTKTGIYLRCSERVENPVLHVARCADHVNTNSYIQPTLLQ